MDLWPVFWGGFKSFDWIIFLVMIAVGFFCRYSFKRADALKSMLNPEASLAAWRDEDGAHLAKTLRAAEEQSLIEARVKADRLYSYFATGTAIFPLLGILGTVKSLLPMVANLADMQQNFFAALTSTFWGLVFAIVFKAFDAPLSAKMMENDKDLELFLSRKPEKEAREAIEV